jgi:hypothetical protein
VATVFENLARFYKKTGWERAAEEFKKRAAAIRAITR